MIQESREWDKKKICMLRILKRCSLWKILNHNGLPDILVKMEIALHEDSECCVPAENGGTTFFKMMSEHHH